MVGVDEEIDGRILEPYVNTAAPAEEMEESEDVVVEETLHTCQNEQEKDILQWYRV